MLNNPLKTISENQWFFAFLFLILGIIISEFYRFCKYIFIDKKRLKNKIERTIKEANKLENSGYEIESIQKYEDILNSHSKQQLQEYFGIIKRGIGNCYLELSQTEKSEKFINLAIIHYHDALLVFNKKIKILNNRFKIIHEYKYPYQYASTLGNLAVASAGLSSIRNKKENLEKAITLCKECLQLYNSDTTQLQYSKFLNNLGAYHTRLADIENRKDNTLKAKNYFEQALKCFNKDQFPFEYSEISTNIATCYIYLSKITDKLNNILKSIKYYEEADELTKPKINDSELFQKLYVTIQDGMANAYVELSNIQDREDNIMKSISAFSEAIKYTQSNQSQERARIKDNLGLAYQSLAKVKDNRHNLETAIKLYQEAIESRNIRDYPYKYADTILHLGTAFGELAKYDNADVNLKKSIHCFNEAQKIYSKVEYKEKNMKINNYLATAYNNLALAIDNENEKKTLLKQSISYSEDVISSISHTNNLFVHSKAVLNLGISNANLRYFENAKQFFKQVILILKDETSNNKKLAEYYLKKLEN